MEAQNGRTPQTQKDEAASWDRSWLSIWLAFTDFCGIVRAPLAYRMRPTLALSLDYLITGHPRGGSLNAGACGSRIVVTNKAQICHTLVLHVGITSHKQVNLIWMITIQLFSFGPVRREFTNFGI